MNDLANYTLGETNKPLILDNHNDFYQILLSMTQQSRRNILVFSHDLDHRIFNTEPIYNSFKDLAIASRHTYIRILLQHTGVMITKGHRLLELSRHLSSHVSIRICAKEHRDIIETFAVVDERGFIIQENPYRYIANSNFNAPQQARNLTEKFVTMWEQGIEDVSLRRLSL